jgi:putative oxidoreductase
MHAPAAVERTTAWALRVAAALSFLAPLLTRLVVGQAYFFTGRGKLQNFENTVGFFSELGIPFPAANAAFVSRLEYYGGMLLIAGLLTRVVALGLAGSMVVALMTADKETFVAALMGRGDASLTDIAAFVYLLFLVWLILFGPGPISLDALLARFFRRREKQETPPVVEGGA